MNFPRVTPSLRKRLDEHNAKRRLGVYEKFKVTRTDGKSRKGKKHARCEYFVLDIDHDEYALPALRAYATACAGEYPNLAADLFEIVAKRKGG